MLLLPAAFVLLIASLITYIMAVDMMGIEEKHSYVTKLYKGLPRFITKTKWFQALHYKALYAYSDLMFWGKCFPMDGHRWTSIDTGIHCPDCGSFIEWEYVDGPSPEDFPQAGNIFNLIV